MMQLMRSDGVAANAAFLEGHFPGNAIVPGAIFLGFLSQALNDQGYEIKKVQRMKFIRQLLPEKPFEIRLDMGETYSKAFWISLDQTIAEARIELQSIDG